MKVIVMGFVAGAAGLLAGCGSVPASALAQQQLAGMQQMSAARHQQNLADKQRAADAAADAKHQEDIQKMMNSSNPSFIPAQPEVATPKPVTAAGSHCTTTTTTSQTDNAGTSTSTTTCH